MNYKIDFLLGARGTNGLWCLLGVAGVEMRLKGGL